MEKIVYTNTNREQVVFSSSPPIILQEKEGFSAVENIITSMQNYESDGEVFVSSRLAVRNLFIKATALGNNREDYLRIRRDMNRIFNPRLGGTLNYTNEIGKYQIDVIPEHAPAFMESEDGIHDKPFEVMFKALDPYWTDKSEIDAEIPMARVENLFEFPLEITNDFEFSRLIAGDVIEIQNNGDVAVGAVFTINVNGILKNPRLYNVITQEYFALNGTFTTGAKLRISTLRGKKRVEEDTGDGQGYKNIMTKRKVESTFLQIDRGINYLQLQADEGVEFTTSYIRFEPKILGV